jgi:hypothetical protein
MVPQMTIRRRDPGRDGTGVPVEHVLVSVDDPGDLGRGELTEVLEVLWAQLGLEAPAQDAPPHRAARDEGPHLLRATAVDRATGEPVSGVAGLTLWPPMLARAVEALRRCGVEIADPEQLLGEPPAGAPPVLADRGPVDPLPHDWKRPGREPSAP